MVEGSRREEVHRGGVRNGHYSIYLAQMQSCGIVFQSLQDGQRKSFALILRQKTDAYLRTLVHGVEVCEVCEPHGLSAALSNKPHLTVGKEVVLCLLKILAQCIP